MPKILYLHGLNSCLQQDRRLVLEADAQVFAPCLDYLNTPKLFDNLIKEYKGVDAIVGTSAGGLVSYYLARYLQVPALLFNPALTHKNQFPFPYEFRGEMFYIQVVIGINDEVIPYEKSLSSILEDINLAACLEVHLINGMHHKFDISIFEREWKYFCSRIF